MCFVSGGKEHPLDQTDSNGLSKFKTLLERDNYQAQAVTLLDKTSVPSECNVVVVAGPQVDYTANEVGALKSYVEGGGRVFFALDPPLDFSSEHIAENTGLDRSSGELGRNPGQRSRSGRKPNGPAVWIRS